MHRITFTGTHLNVPHHGFYAEWKDSHRDGIFKRYWRTNCSRIGAPRGQGRFRCYPVILDYAGLVELTWRLKVAISYSSSSSDKLAHELIEQISSFRNGSAAIQIRADLHQAEAPREIVKATVAAFGEHIDILVNNAGTGILKELSDITLEDFANVYDVNVRAVLLMSQAVLPYLRSPGRIINIGSVASRHGYQSLSLYCSSKTAVEGLTRCFATELGSSRHTVNCLNVGPVQTDLLNGIPKELVELQKKTTPLENRMGTTDDIAQLVGFLAEESSQWITGQTISASGGYSMY